MKIAFVALDRRYASIRDEFLDEVDNIGRSGHFVLGSRVETFEREFASYIGTKHAISVANGSDALFLALKALGIGSGDEVITVSNSFIASAWVIVATGAVPIFADIDSDLNIDPRLLEPLISSKTKAILPVHLTGNPARMEQICSFADKRGLFVVEDAAQAVGAEINGKKVGSFGVCAGFSLHPLKNVGVFGDGGIITTNDSSLAEKIRLLRNHGLETRDKAVTWGYNSRLDEIQAACATIQLRRIDSWNTRRRSIAEFYTKSLSDQLTIPAIDPLNTSVFHNYVVRSLRRNELIRDLTTASIETKIHYPTPIHLQDCYLNKFQLRAPLTLTEKYSTEILSLPVYPELTDAEVEHISKTICLHLSKSCKRSSP